MGVFSVVSTLNFSTMSSSRLMNIGVARKVQPLLSLDRAEARSRVISLYKAWYRQIPQIEIDYELPVTKAECRIKLKEVFMKNKDVKDIRAIDTLVLRGQMELQETVQIWKQKHGLMAYWKETAETTKPKDFM